jgi:hypothetical protein
MSFLNIAIKIDYYDRILDLYNDCNFEESRKLISQLNLTDRQNFIYWLFVNYDKINNKELIAFILDEIF